MNSLTLSKLKSFALNLLLLTLGIVIVAMALQFFIPEMTLPDNYWGMIIYFFLMTLIVHLFFISASRYKTQISISYSWATIILKLLISIMFIALLVYINPHQAMKTVVWFFIMYLIYTGFELFLVIKQIQGRNAS